MNFSQALEAIKSGKKVERLGWGEYAPASWGSLGEYEPVREGDTRRVLSLLIALRDDLPYIALQLSENSYRSWYPDSLDLFAEDWQVVN